MLHSPAMRISPVDLPSLREQLQELTARVCEVWETSVAADDAIGHPQLLRDALSQWVDMLDQLQHGGHRHGAGRAELDTLGEYGLQLLEDLAAQAASLQQKALAIEIEQLCLPFALWIARNGGELRNLRPIVNALAALVDPPERPQMMAQLCACCCELVDAASPNCQEPEDSDAYPPWRQLLLNRAIIATHSRQPELMTAAFDAVVEHLPHDAQRFFTERMEQLATSDYPAPVHELVRRYFLAHAQRSRLH